MSTTRKKTSAAKMNEPGERAVADNNPERASTDAPDFFEQLQRFTAEEWQGLKIYVYRTWPIIDRRDESHFLARISEPLDEDYILRFFGSGKYFLRLNNRRGESVASKTISVHNPSYPPKVSPDEVVQTDPRNERYFRVWAPAPATPTPATSDTPAVQELSKLAAKVLQQHENKSNQSEQETLNATLVKWALDQAAKERDGNDPARLVTLLRELKALLPEQQAHDGLAQLDRMLEVFERLNPPRPAIAEPQDPLEYVQKVLTLADKLRPAQAGANDGSTLASIAAITHEAVELLKNPVAMLTQVWAASKMRESNPTAPSAQHPPPPAESPNVPSPQNTGPHPTVQPPLPSPSAAGTPQTSEPLDLRQKHLIGLAQLITPAMLRYLHEDSPGAELGANFAGWVFDGYGAEDLKAIQQVGETGIIELYRRSPVWPVLAPLEPKFQEFVAAFVVWEPSDNDAEDGEFLAE